MLTIAEAIRRMQINNMRLSRYGSLQWRVSFNEDSESMGTSRLFDHDDLEGAVIAASNMRRERSKEYA